MAAGFLFAIVRLGINAKCSGVFGASAGAENENCLHFYTKQKNYFLNMIVLDGGNPLYL